MKERGTAGRTINGNRITLFGKTEFMKTVAIHLSIIAVLLSVPLFSYAHSVTAPPLIIINGRTTDLPDLKGIEPENIESVDTEPASEENIAKYGERANNGIIVVTLKYDEPARFAADGMTFDEYVAARVKWGANEPAARVVIRYTIGTDGRITAGEVLESTDNRLRRKVTAAVENTPAWIPAKKNGEPVESEYILQIQLPEGKPLPRPIELIIR